MMFNNMRYILIFEYVHEAKDHVVGDWNRQEVVDEVMKEVVEVGGGDDGHDATFELLCDAPEELLLLVGE